MRPVFQDKFGAGEGAGFGNCVQASWASILEVPLNHVPNFSEDARPQGTDQYEEECKFARSIGLDLIPTIGPQLPRGMEDTLHFGRGISPRGFGHRVVMRGHQLVHDPHPAGGGVELYGRIFLVPRR